jgi:hypothetical protein
MALALFKRKFRTRAAVRRSKVINREAVHILSVYHILLSSKPPSTQAYRKHCINACTLLIFTSKNMMVKVYARMKVIKLRGMFLMKLLHLHIRQGLQNSCQLL